MPSIDPLSVRERIVQASMKLFAQRGYGSTSVADIAAASGLLKGNLAYYFKTKADVLGAVTAARRERIRAELSDGLPSDAAPRVVILRLLQQVRATADELAAFGCPVGSLSTELGKGGDGELRTEAAALLLEIEIHLTRQFERVMPARAARSCSEHLLALLQGAAVVAHARQDPEVVRRQVDGAVAWLDNVLSQQS